MRHLTPIFVLLLFFFSYSFSQKKEFQYLEKGTSGIIKVNVEDVRILSVETDKKNTILYSFGIWCAPCREHLKNALNITKEYSVNLYILLIEAENDPIVKKTVDYLIGFAPNVNILILKDEYGNRRNRKYKRFLKEITPDEFENLNGMSKYIVLDKQGEIIMITTWKDNVGNDWKDDSKMLREKVLPLLKKI